MFFIIIERLWKSSQKVCIFCAETVKENVQPLPNIFFHVEDPRNFQADSVMIMFDAAPARMAFLQFLISFLSLFWYPAPNELHCSSKMFFIITERLWKIFSTFCAEIVNDCFWKKMCSWYFLCWGKCVAASENISMFFKERAAASKKMLRKNKNSSLTSLEKTAASERYQH